MRDTATSPSPFVEPPRPITATDDEIRTALADAELVPLLAALAFLTGDLDLLRPDLRIDPLLAGMPQGGLTDDQQARARDLALAALIAYRDGGSRPAAPPGSDDLLRIMEFCTGADGDRKSTRLNSSY